MSRFDIKIQDVEGKTSPEKNVLCIYNQEYFKTNEYHKNTYHRIIGYRMNHKQWVYYWIDCYEHYDLFHNVFLSLAKRWLEKKVVRKKYLLKNVFNNQTFTIFPKVLDLLIIDYLFPVNT